MKKLLFPALLSVTGFTAIAQQPVSISFGGGINTTTSSFKDKTHLGNGYHLTGDVFVPFLDKNNGKFKLGLLVGGTYYTHKNRTPEADEFKTFYKLYSGELAINAVQNSDETNKGIAGSLGMQADIGMGPFTVSPSISGGYFSMKQKSFSQPATLMVNGSSQNILLLNMQEKNHSGFIATPRIKISYAISPFLSVYTAASFNTGSKITTQQEVLKPEGGFNDKHTYEPAQLSGGTMISQPVKATYQTMLFSVGINLKTGSRKAKQSQGLNFGEKVSSGMQSGGPPQSLVAASADTTKRPGGAVSSSYAAGRVVQSDSSKKANEMPSRLSMTPTTTRQSNAINNADSTKNPLYEAGGHSGNNPMYNPSIAATPGSPIGGIVVKGGKNPGGNVMQITSNDKGEFELNGMEAGNYQFTLTAPETSQGKSINEKGVKRNEAARPGQPIGGIVVKGGKNPGGNMTDLTVDKNGTIQFEVLETGNYKFIIQTPENPNGNQKQKKKVIEKATSGLKDTLKTNV